MPVQYVAPGPVLSMASIYGPRRDANRGGGGQIDPSVGFPPQQMDRSGEYQNRLDMASLEGNMQANLQGARVSAQSQLQNQAAQLDAWQFEQRVTAQEAAQLRADQNAIAAIQADPSWSPAEKQQMILRIKSRVDWVSERQKRDLQQAQVETQQSIARQHKMETDLIEQRIKNQAKSINEKIKTVVDDDAAQEYTQTILDEDPSMAFKPVELAAEVTRRAIADGRATRFAPDAQGTFDLSKGVRVGQEQETVGGGGARKGTRGGKKVEVDEDERWDKAVDRATKILTGPGSVTTPSAEQVIELATKLSKRPMDEGSPEAVQEKVNAEHLKALDGFQAGKNAVLGNPYLDGASKKEVAGMYQELYDLARKYPPGPLGKRTPGIQKRLDGLAEKILKFQAWMKQVEEAKAKQQASTPGQPTAAPAAGEQHRVMPRTLSTDIMDIGESIVEGAEGIGGAVGDATRKARDEVRKAGKSVWRYLTD